VSTSTPHPHLNDQFLDTFGDIEKSLRIRLRLPPRDRSPLSDMIERYRRLNPYWQEQAVDRGQEVVHFRGPGVALEQLPCDGFVQPVKE